MKAPYSKLKNPHDIAGDEPVLKSLMSLAAPAILAGFFIMGFELVDMFWVGRLGARPVAALSAATFFIWLLRALADTVATGAIALVSRRTGEGGGVRLIHTVAHALTAAVLFTLLTWLAAVPLLSRIFDWIPLEKEIAGMARQYAGIFLAGLLFVYMMTTAERVIRGMGDTKSPMRIIGFSLLLNAVLDPVFIFILRMGLAGAAYATLLAHIIGCLCMMWQVFLMCPEAKKRPVTFNFDFLRCEFLPIVRIGGPMALSGVGFAVIYLFLSGIISHFGSAPLAAVGIGHRIEALPFFLTLGFSMAVSTWVGQNLGAGKPERAEAGVRLSLILVSSALILISVAFFFFAEGIFRIFIRDGAVIRHGVQYLRAIAVFEVFLGFEVVLEGAFAGAGDTKPPMWIAFPLTFLRVPLSYFLGIHLGWGVQAVWWMISVTTFLKGSMMWIWFRRGKWKEKKV